AKVLCALVREWLKDLRDEAEQLQARLKFKRNILGSLNQICCNLFSSFNRIIDEFEPCQESLKKPLNSIDLLYRSLLTRSAILYQVCRCHGYPLDDERGNKLVKSTSCPVTDGELVLILNLGLQENDKMVKICCIKDGYAGGLTMAMIALKCPDIEVVVVDISVPHITAWNTNPYLPTRPR
ncbi:sperm protamine like protein, partial [Tanacetum coccineum]